jgi:hypothetical protein
MFNIKFKPANYLFNVLVLFLIFAVCGMSPSYAAPAAIVGGLVSGTILMAFKTALKPGLMLMAVQKEIWENDIMEQIFKDNSFVRLSFRADDYVNGRAVHIPQSGGSGNVSTNRSALPATVRKRTDTDVIYIIDEYTTDPVLIPNADTVELSYDKRNSVLGEDKNKLSQTVAEEMLYNWLHDFTTGTAVPMPNTNYVYTSGAAVAATAPGSTGTRKAASITDLQAASTLLRQQNRWFEGQMNALMPASMQAQMFPADSLTTATYMQSATEEERRKGLIMRAQGFGIMQRSTVVVLDNTGAVKAPGAASAVGDCEAILCWYTLAVETAYGTTKMFEQVGAPEYYGDLYSFLVRMGGRARRSDFLGIVLIVQTGVS